MKRFIALARVSSREQEREGFSLDVQEDAFYQYAERENGEIVKLFRIAETASKKEERTAFNELLGFARQNVGKLDGILFYKVDRAARNLFDYVELERLEKDLDLNCIYVSQPTDFTPAGRLNRRILATMATFYTEQQSVDVREGMERRVKSGLFCGLAPYGYRNVRIEGRSLVEIDPENAPKVQRIFEIYSHHEHTIDDVCRALDEEGITWKKEKPKFTRSKVHKILRDRAYIGEVYYKGQWYQGTHPPLVSKDEFDRVQVLMGEKHYNAHDSVYGAGMIKCGFCGKSVTVEIKKRQLKRGETKYRYYRCAAYNKKGHPRTRVNESKLDAQILAMFAKMRVEDEKVRHWIVNALRAKTKHQQRHEQDRLKDLHKEHASIVKQRDCLLNLRLAEEIESETFSTKNKELQAREEKVALLIEANGRRRSENTDLAIKVFELSQSLIERWDKADIPEKRKLLEIVCLNFSLDDATLCIEMRKPFDVIAKGLSIHSGRGERI